MIKKEENQQSSSSNFKLKLVKKPGAAWKIKDNNITPELLEDIIMKMYSQKTPRQPVIHTSAAGMALINKAIEQQLKSNKNEYGKTTGFGSKKSK